MAEFILGLDESGKGPVIGPMILAGVLIEKKHERHLRKLGVKDSKEITPKRRNFLEVEIKKIIKDYHLIVCEASEIDSTNGDGINLTELEAREFAKIINQFNNSEDNLKVIIDCPSIGIKSWTETLKPKIKNLSNIELVIEHKADKNHISVSTASIIAKCERERQMAKLKEKYGNIIGSGYCHDPLTISFIEKFALKFKNDGLFRKSWSTWKNAADKLAQIELDL